MIQKLQIQNCKKKQLSILHVVLQKLKNSNVNLHINLQIYQEKCKVQDKIYAKYKNFIKITTID